MRVRAVVASVALVLSGLALTAAPAGADHGGPHCGSGLFACGGQTPGSQTGGAEETSGGGGGDPVDFIRYFDPEGTSEDSAPDAGPGCWGIQAVPQGEGMTWAEAVESQSSQGENGVLWGNCDIEETIDPEFIAQAYWFRQTTPPPPSPLAVAPGKALTGLPGYLEIGGDVPAVATFGTPIGTLTFTMTPRYVVDWGDGATTHTESQGGPYPNGDLTHTYVDAGGVEITVDAYWRATWTLGGAGGDLPELPEPTSAALDLPVEQRQAVID
ncbi:MAG TPA: hypothetical protein VFU19_02005 [Iamia sp.]|nr:hypothetical protein [Iamia sp.]